MNIDLKNVPQQGGTKGAGETAGPSSRTAVQQGAPRESAGAAQSSGAPAASGDSVSLTRGGQQLAQLQAGLAQQPVVDKQRVAELRQAIQSGQYHVNPGQVADKLLGFEGQAKQRS
ncbi:flagellar biosynthesis anti-sigma factor FlgM [Acidihalobacter prosperus]|uniref:Negative regulator of flagellin synthesis n=1 Tax=Acidihalobacter prosperus TaxID=160660 RepID=A0A1A6C5F0_9GAMM|nr:flagellar biosynthesis anti-sigma factor FlgM [Acidihalobacter prosperus]OBS09787.1 flagellar biosynthesis anti-sigma factor FlgM [Acidihalobacter prosperus]